MIDVNMFDSYFISFLLNNKNKSVELIRQKK